MNMWSVHNYI